MQSNITVRTNKEAEVSAEEQYRLELVAACCWGRFLDQGLSVASQSPDPLNYVRWLMEEV